MESDTMFIAMNRFKVVGGKEADFEEIWQGRRSYLKDVPGFVQFALLKSEAGAEYLSHSTWTDRDSFIAWTQSEAFAAGHRQGSLAGILEGPPQVSTYEAIIVEP
jgi:heme-degrading monooxygenase HmoA